MSRFVDRDYLVEEQYASDDNLRARIELHRRFSTAKKPWQHWVFDRLEAPDEADVLELGCGPGELWAENADRIPAGWRLTLTDLSPGMVEAARAKLGDRAVYSVADAAEIPFADESFDLVVANHVLFHVPEPERALAEVRRVLRRRGCFVATLLGPDHLRELYGASVVRASSTIGLHDGQERFERFFADVERHRYDAPLAVTEVEPVLAFVRSGFIDFDENDLRERVETEIREHGFFHITRDTGLFRGRRP